MALTFSVKVFKKSDWQHQHFKRFKNFVKLKLIVSNFKVLVVALIFDNFLVGRDG